MVGISYGVKNSIGIYCFVAVEVVIGTGSCMNIKAFYFI